MVIILIPSHFEAKTFIANLTERKDFKAGEADCVEGISGQTDVTVGVIGMGPPHAAIRARAVIDEVNRRRAAIAEQVDTRRIRGVILAGFAGALEPSLERGDIFITAGSEFLLPLLPVHERPIAATLETVDKIAGTSKAKGELFVRTGSWLCDMEQTHVAAVVKDFGLRFIGVRIVSDVAHEDLPADTLSRSYDQETGMYTPWKLAGHLTLNPLKTVPLASFVRLLPPIRNRMSDRLHTWLKLAGPRLFP